ncbi:MAG: FAD-dependent thymidylate synthase [Candidatus Bathyarchaeia archaeon]
MNVELVAMTQPVAEKYFRTPRDLLVYAYNYADFVKLDPDNLKHGPEVIQNALKVDATSPLEHVVFTFKIEGISRACSHQLVRHRICTFTQQSQRKIEYSEGFDYATPPSIQNNQSAKEAFQNSMQNARTSYATLRSHGVRKEDARFVLPNAVTTGLLWTINVNALRHFLKLRLSKRSQWEIRELAKRIFDVAYGTLPEAFEDLKQVRES